MSLTCDMVRMSCANGLRSCLHSLQILFRVDTLDTDSSAFTRPWSTMGNMPPNITGVYQKPHPAGQAAQHLLLHLVGGVLALEQLTQQGTHHCPLPSQGPPQLGTTSLSQPAALELLWKYGEELQQCEAVRLRVLDGLRAAVRVRLLRLEGPHHVRYWLGPNLWN
ncbi:hypothetical protein EYF80_008275 [Liparis tanakae]|uniref:Uncharacterized protein n=1 Tax=Liparis tanakae TaxID=230148 RepID=A0A4Z2IW91_9TELE|nr:hypothetical protein EYF80_008275 [Liparis tanakae]